MLSFYSPQWAIARQRCAGAVCLSVLCCCSAAAAAEQSCRHRVTGALLPWSRYSCSSSARCCLPHIWNTLAPSGHSFQGSNDSSISELFLSFLPEQAGKADFVISMLTTSLPAASSPDFCQWWHSACSSTQDTALIPHYVRQSRSSVGETLLAWAGCWIAPSASWGLEAGSSSLLHLLGWVFFALFEWLLCCFSMQTAVSHAVNCRENFLGETSSVSMIELTQ